MNDSNFSADVDFYNTFPYIYFDILSGYVL